MPGPLALHVPEVDFCVIELIDPELQLGCGVTASTCPRSNLGVWIARGQLSSTDSDAYAMLMHGGFAGVLMKKSYWVNDGALTEYRPRAFRRCVCRTLLDNMPETRFRGSETAVY